jgi:hypothetical protein
VDEPAVYAGVSAEQRFGQQLPGQAAMLMMPRDLFGGMLARPAPVGDGKPLWTIDVRPRAPGRM